LQNKHSLLERFKVIAITHQRVSLTDVGRFHLEDTIYEERLQAVKTAMQLDELLYVSTCNRVEFGVLCDADIDNDWLDEFYTAFAPQWDEDWREQAVLYSEVYEGKNAIEHLFSVASSLDSMVVGEREIIAQVRQAYERSAAAGITGDFTRLLMRKTIETGKEIYTQTEIATKSVSVVALAYQQLAQEELPKTARILIIGSGQTNTNLLRFLKADGYSNFTVFNRNVANAKTLVEEVGGEAHALSQLPHWKNGFDVLLSCTAASEYIVNPDLYQHLLNGDTDRKIIVDLAVPADIDPAIKKNAVLRLIDVAYLRPVATANLTSRKKEMQLCRAIVVRSVREFQQMHRERQIELAMQRVPGMVRDIRSKAVNSVFEKELSGLDAASVEVLNKVLNYVEKKYISVPMKMAKQILLENKAK